MKSHKICGYKDIGKSHQDKGGKCQDSFFIGEGKGFIVAAIADGLSASKHSHVASDIAVNETVRYCLQHITNDYDKAKILSIINKAFDEAHFKIKQTAGFDLNNYDTTLTLAVYMNGDVYYGHVGDSGIIALREDGKFDCVTKPQSGTALSSFVELADKMLYLSKNEGRNRINWSVF